MPTLSAVVHERVLREIRAGSIAPGETLDERALAQRYQVSRTPVREALSQLYGLGVLAAGPRGGFAIPRLHLRELREQLEFLGELEASCARLAARRMHHDLMKRLCDAQDQCEQSALRGDASAYERANELFHATIHEAACNRAIADQLELVMTRCAVYRTSRFSKAGRMARSVAEHRAIASCLQRGDDAGAHAAMLAHVASGGNEFAELLATMPVHLAER